jgi:hypothetical protein
MGMLPLALVSDALPHDPVGGQAAGLAMEWSARGDRIGDGKHSRTEVASRRFSEFDADRDGFVILAEWRAALNRAALRQLDRDGDRRISQQEFNALYQDSEHYFRTR